MYHSISAAIVTAATLEPANSKFPSFLSLDTNSLNHPLKTLTQQLSNNSFSEDYSTLQQLQLITENSEVYDLWSDCRGDSAFGIGFLAIT
jgi:hypothetical protein